MSEFIHTGSMLLPIASVQWVDLSALDTEGSIQILTDHGMFKAEGAFAVRILLELKPESLEGRRVRWIKRSWTVHNLIGHPAMEILSRLGWTRLGLKIHDATVPKASKLRR